MDVALHLHDLRLAEEAGDSLSLDGHADVERRIDLAHQVDVVKRRIAVEKVTVWLAWTAITWGV
jgi:hypothetical protein